MPYELYLLSTKHCLTYATDCVYDVVEKRNEEENHE